MGLYACFNANKELQLQTKYINAYSVQWNGKEYTIIVPRKIANKRTYYFFQDNTIFWMQIPRFPRLTGPYGEMIPICKFNSDKIANTLFVVRGTPLGDEGLDNGIFRSSRKYDENFVNCISYEKFKKM